MDFYRWVRTQWDRAGAVAAVLLGIIALLLGYQGTGDATLPTEQIPYIVSGGIFGLFALGIGATLWLSADLRDEWRKLDDIHAELRQRCAAPRPTPVAERTELSEAAALHTTNATRHAAAGEDALR